MAKVSLVLSCSHSPFLYTPPEQWNDIRVRRPVREDVPHDSLEINQKKFAQCMKAFSILKEKLDSVRPDVLLIFGDDQYELFNFSNLPALGIYLGAEFEGYRTRSTSGPTVPGAPRVKSPKTPENWVKLKGHPELSKELLSGLMTKGFDLAFSQELPNKEAGMGHAFMRPAHYVTPNYQVPIIPIFVNCYYPPQPTAKRCYQLGKAIRELIEESPLDLNVAALGSGGLWHTPGAKDAYLNEEFDQGSLEAVKSGDAKKFAEYFDNGRPPGGTVGGTGETRNWIAAAGVADGTPGKVVDYVPVYASPCGMGFAYWETA